MELTARVVFALFAFFFAFGNCDCRKIDMDTVDYNTDRFIVYGCSKGFCRLCGKAWRSVKSSKSTRRRMRQRRAYSSGLTGMDPLYMLLLSGDLEINPGLTNNFRSTKAAAKDESPDFSDILLRLEKE